MHVLISDLQIFANLALSFDSSRLTLESTRDTCDIFAHTFRLRFQLANAQSEHSQIAIAKAVCIYV